MSAYPPSLSALKQYMSTKAEIEHVNSKIRSLESNQLPHPSKVLSKLNKSRTKLNDLTEKLGYERTHLMSFSAVCVSNKMEVDEVCNLKHASPSSVSVSVHGGRACPSYDVIKERASAKGINVNN